MSLSKLEDYGNMWNNKSVNEIWCSLLIGSTEGHENLNRRTSRSIGITSMVASDDPGFPSERNSIKKPVTSSKLQLCANSQNQKERMPRTINREMDNCDPTSDLLEHNRFVDSDILAQNNLHCAGLPLTDQPIQNVSQSPRIVHYHLTIQNCDGVEICVDNRKQNFTQKTAYSADGQRLKRLSWIEVPSNPIDVGPSLHSTRTIAATENNQIVPNKDEEMVFISPEAEELFCHDEDQVIIQESCTVPHPIETPSPQVDTGMRSRMASIMMNTDEGETPMPALTNVHLKPIHQINSLLCLP